PADEAENIHGRLSASQARVLRGQRLTYALGSLGFVVVAGLLLGALWLHGRDPAFGGRGQLWLGGAIGALWLWLLAPSLAGWRYTSQDLQSGQVAWVDGPAVAVMGMGVGLVAPVKYSVTIAGRRFRVGAAEYALFRPLDPYRAYFAPRSQRLLGARRLAMPVGAPAAAQPPADALAKSGLNARELDILRLAAAGLSNKEIASQLAYSLNTVKAYLSQAYAKLGVQRRTQAIAAARELGLLDARPDSK
ncbi:MAG: response regulator transcription factor, partial [Anaerolineales bacterium]